MELGIGHHGEPGIKVVDLASADEMAALCLDIILPDLPFNEGDDLVVLISGLGATPVSELYVFYREVSRLLRIKNMTIHKSYIGNYFTSLEMMGVTLTLMKVDDELRELIDYKANSVALKQF
jgi:phosphoenolpyruvate---glycerone phosphotransferase subunit DhaK